mmetsp:Transcript_44367/g.94551  ORF Transcript_44367/g.94551 Transcript_44367/m.94551 type:complete len:730 (+) Transcript_44367:48-2237(+)
MTGVTLSTTGQSDVVLPVDSTPLSVVAELLCKHWPGTAPSLFVSGERALSPYSDESLASVAREGDRIQVVCHHSRDATNDRSDVRVPAIILTGFLGAGKTTLLNHFLKRQSEMKVGVIENEFGAVAIDEALLAQSEQQAEQVVVLDNGCMCCTVRGDLLKAFEAVRQQMVTSGTRLDFLIIETTGLADPVPIVRTLRQTPGINSHFRLDGVVTLADAKTIATRLAEAGDTRSREVYQQLAFANLMVLTKIDLVSGSEALRTVSKLKSLSDSSCQLTAAVRGVLPGKLLTELRAFALDSVGAEVEAHASGHHGHSHGHHGHAHHHQPDCDSHDHSCCDHACADSHDCCEDHSHPAPHPDDIGSFSIVTPRAVDQLKFARWIRKLTKIPEEAGILYRSKAILPINGCSRKLVFHAVGDVVEKDFGPDWAPNECRECKIVFIGRRLDQDWFTSSFNDCTVPLMRHPTVASPWANVAPAIASFLGSGDAARMSRVDLGSFHSLQVPLGGAGSHPLNNQVYLHSCAPISMVSAYMNSFTASKVKLATPCNTDFLFGKPMIFDSAAEVEACGITFQEVAETLDSDTQSSIIEFGWRRETVAEYIGSLSSANSVSTLVKASYDNNGDIDELRFRWKMSPAEQADLEAVRVSLQLVGGKSTTGVYQLSFHSVHPGFQVHIPVDDHRRPLFETEVLFHRHHTVWTHLLSQSEPFLRCLVRIKPVNSADGPLQNMCGCC